MKLWVDRVESALGELMIVTDETHLCALEYDGHRDRMMSFLQHRYQSIDLIPNANPLNITQKLMAYLQGDYKAIEDIPVHPGGTAFQQQVWALLKTIPHGQTWTYGELATALGKPTAARAVGMANSKNPIAIVIPCHRVIGANNALTGYSGGVDRKWWLLNHEGCAALGHQSNQAIKVFPPPKCLTDDHLTENQQLSLL